MDLLVLLPLVCVLKRALKLAGVLDLMHSVCEGSPSLVMRAQCSEWNTDQLYGCEWERDRKTMASKHYNELKSPFSSL